MPSPDAIKRVGDLIVFVVTQTFQPLEKRRHHHFSPAEVFEEEGAVATVATKKRIEHRILRVVGKPEILALRSVLVAEHRISSLGIGRIHKAEHTLDGMIFRIWMANRLSGKPRVEIAKDDGAFPQRIAPAIEHRKCGEPAGLLQ